MLDPDIRCDIWDRWIECGLVWHAHARAAVTNNPHNVMARHPDGSVGRGIQYPCIQPAPGHHHAAWDEAALEPWKTVMRWLLAYHARTPASPLWQFFGAS